MSRAVKQGVVVFGMLCTQIGAAAGQTDPRTFASPSLRTAGAGDPYAVGASPRVETARPNAAVPPTSGRMPVRSSLGPAPVPATVSAVSGPGPVAHPPATVEVQPQATPRKPTPQWPLTAEDIQHRRQQEPAGKDGAAPPPRPGPASVWPANEVIIAKARCATLLKDIAAVYIPMEPLREGDCGTPAPVQLMAIGKNPQVVISPPAIVTCDLVVAVAQWLQKDIQPSARKHLGSPIVKIENMSSYSCRNAYGRAKTRLSEHGRANALDIRGFLTASGQGPELLADWGPTMRDARASEVAPARAAAAKAAATRIDADRKTVDTGVRQSVETGNIPGGVGTLIEGLPRVRVLTPGQKADDTGSASAFAPATKLGGPGSERAHVAGAAATGAKVASAPEPPASIDNSRRQQFLREAHTSACRTFATVLGPEANNAHRNHFHIDMADRGSGPFCE